ncbi:hypothetical protein D3C71_1626030 [compost metagenome]
MPVGLHLGQHGRQVIARELGGLGLGLRQSQLFPIDLGQGRAPCLARPVQDGSQAVDHVAVHRRVRRQVELGVLGLGLGEGLASALLDRRRHRLGRDGVDRGIGADDGDHPFNAAEEAGAILQPLALFLPPSTGGEVERHQGGVVQQAKGGLLAQVALYLLGRPLAFDARRAVKATTLLLEVVLPEAAVLRLVDGHGSSVSLDR